MRHGIAKRKLNKTSTHRIAMLENMAVSLIMHETIKTTLPKAKELRSFIEPLITLAKKDSLHSRRLVIRKIPKKNVVRILFEEIAPLFSTRPGGYTRITKLGLRDNDRAPVSIIEFVESIENPQKGDSEVLEAEK